VIDREGFDVDEFESHPIPLSAAGEARREEMLSRLQAALVRKRRARWACRVAALAGVPAMVIAAIIIVRPGPGGPESGGGTSAISPPAAHPVEGEWKMRIQIVHNDPGVLARSAPAAKPLEREAVIDDEELLKLLHDLGRPSGLARVPGGVYLTSNLAPLPGRPGGD
jgi:hypothetical protein